jgi:hypothetical protein
MRKNLLILAAVLACVGTVVALGALLVQGPLSEVHGPRQSPSSEAMARRYHVGEPPCLRYQEEGGVPEEKLTRAAEALWESGFSAQQVSEDLWGIFLRWQVDREAAIHARPEAEEWIEALTEHMPLSGRIAFWWKQERFRKALTVNQDKYLAEGTVALEQLPPAQRQRLRALWEAHPEALVPSNLIEVFHVLRYRETEARLEVLARAIEEHVRQGEPAPTSLDALTGLAPEALRDAWGNDFAYDPEIPGGVRLFSYGGDKTPGGEGPDADIVRDVILDPGAVETAGRLK